MLVLNVTMEEGPSKNQVSDGPIVRIISAFEHQILMVEAGYVVDLVDEFIIYASRKEIYL